MHFAFKQVCDNAKKVSGDQVLCKFEHLIDRVEYDAQLMVGPTFARHIANRMYRGMSSFPLFLQAAVMSNLFRWLQGSILRCKLILMCSSFPIGIRTLSNNGNPPATRGALFQPT